MAQFYKNHRAVTPTLPLAMPVVISRQAVHSAGGLAAMGIQWLREVCLASSGNGGQRQCAAQLQPPAQSGCH